MADIQKLLSQMTLEEKIGQLMQYNGNVLMDTGAEITGPMQQFGLTEEDLGRLGSVLNFASADEMKQMQDIHLAKDPNKIPMLFMMDVIHGYRTIFPIPLGLGCSFDPSLAEECARVAAKEAAASGVQVPSFAPVANNDVDNSGNGDTGAYTDTDTAPQSSGGDLQAGLQNGTVTPVDLDNSKHNDDQQAVVTIQSDTAGDANE